MDKVRLGVIGCGGMAQNHMRQFENVPELHFAACADPVAANRERVAEQYGAKPFDDGYDLINSGEVDAVFVATPHYFHPPYAIAAFEAGLHVLSEKPVAVTANAAQQMNDAADKRPDLLYGAMFQRRLNPLWQKVKFLIDTGEVGELLRANWTITTWFRTQTYYDSGDWRATWKGEGGGVLLNQCPHNLDIYTWLLGMPTRVQAEVGLGKYHNIEVEDDVSAVVRFENGATGTFITNTAERPGVNRFEIVGDKSTLIVEDSANRITQYRHDTLVSEVREHSHKRMSADPADQYVITPGGHDPKHGGVWRNFIHAILGNEALTVPGREGIFGLELGNAMLMSGIEDKPVDLPMDRDAYEQLMQRLIDEAEEGSGNGAAKKGVAQRA